MVRQHLFDDALDTERTHGGPCLVPSMCPNGGPSDPLPVLVVRTVRRPNDAAHRFECCLTRSEQARRLRRPPLGSLYTTETDQAVGEASLVAHASKCTQRTREQGGGAPGVAFGERNVAEIMDPTRVLPQAQNLEQTDALLVKGCCSRMGAAHSLYVAELSKEHCHIP